MESETAVALVAPRGPDADTYRTHLVRLGAEVSHFLSMADFREGCIGRRFAGLAVDFAAIANLGDDDKAFFAELNSSLPVVRLRRVGPPAEVAGTWKGRTRAGEPLLEAFMEAVKAGGLRLIRLAERKMMVLPARVFLEEKEIGGPGLKASISNLSRQGFYVVTPETAPRERCWLVVPALGDETPVPCEIRWATPWGTSTETLPGWGVRCLSMSPIQQETLDKLVGPGK